eukprot:CAMPEP_0174711458 /NCGR_PEP_ID=MMETSP1094-20130205/12776_1 /TAXON_ID=156173 /ORGANISM="Chrysochromulina brevifilum, Strain UTEX LB 985" /LENGTH=219 /DNA_ID=CAMNT_0015910401 /DNA_START=62 /DNA_END=722 /DNA_ORIENTATION=-
MTASESAKSAAQAANSAKCCSITAIIFALLAVGATVSAVGIGGWRLLEVEGQVAVSSKTTADLKQLEINHIQMQLAQLQQNEKSVGARLLAAEQGLAALQQQRTPAAATKAALEEKKGKRRKDEDETTKAKGTDAVAAKEDDSSEDPEEETGEKPKGKGRKGKKKGEAKGGDGLQVPPSTQKPEMSTLLRSTGLLKAVTRTAVPAISRHYTLLRRVPSL